MKPVVSINLCTRNNESSLLKALESLAAISVPEDVDAELVIIDNASKDSKKTEKAIHDSRAMLDRVFQDRIIYVEEPTPGKCHALNTGIAATRADIILFTDDDLRYPSNWIDSVCRPILNGSADWTVGGIKLAPYLIRPWQTPQHRSWLATTDCSDPDSPWMIGANSAVHRRVFEKVPLFDTELGPGALGFSDDTLFGRQLEVAGYRLKGCLDVSVEHNCDASRLTRASYLGMAEKLARSSAYLAYHWLHEEHPDAAKQRLVHKTKLELFRRVRRGWEGGDEGLPPWEMHYLHFTFFYDQWLIESKRPRQYEKKGLVKLTA